MKHIVGGDDQLHGCTTCVAEGQPIAKAPRTQMVVKANCHRGTAKLKRLEKRKPEPTRLAEREPIADNKENQDARDDNSEDASDQHQQEQEQKHRHNHDGEDYEHRLRRSLVDFGDRKTTPAFRHRKRTHPEKTDGAVFCGCVLFSCFWVLLAAPGCFWVLLGASGCFWVLLVGSGCSWLLPFWLLLA